MSRLTDAAKIVSKAAGAGGAGVTVLVGAGLLTGTPAVWATGVCVAVGAAAGAWLAPGKAYAERRLSVRATRTPDAGE